MLIDNLIIPFATVAYLVSKFKEKRLNYQLNFTKLPNSWLQTKMVIEMDQVWKREGLDAIGTNYFTFGSLEEGISSRFNPKSSYYQSWLGGYLVRFNTQKMWTINDHFKLTQADQKNWLKLYGASNPKVDIDYKSVENLGEIKVSGFNGQLYKGDIYSSSDVGKGDINFYRKLQIAGLAFYMNRINPKLKLCYSNLVSVWTDENILDSYQYIQLRGYIVILNISDSVKGVLYVNAANYKDRNGKEYDNFKKLDNEMLDLIKSIEIQKK